MGAAKTAKSKTKHESLFLATVATWQFIMVDTRKGPAHSVDVKGKF